MTASYKLSWVLSPFGFMLTLFSIILYVKSHRLKIKDFKLRQDNEIHHTMDEDDTNPTNKIEET